MCSPGELYSKLFDEIEKIKFWKVKVESETMQQERKLQESKITIETQRKAIQELQVRACNVQVDSNQPLLPFTQFFIATMGLKFSLVEVNTTKGTSVIN